jgi:hypothetical protein
MNAFIVWRICISSWWSGWSSKFFGLLIHQRRGDRAVGSGGFLSYTCYYCSSMSLNMSDSSGQAAQYQIIDIQVWGFI